MPSSTMDHEDTTEISQAYDENLDPFSARNAALSEEVFGGPSIDLNGEDGSEQDEHSQEENPTDTTVNRANSRVSEMMRRGMSEKANLKSSFEDNTAGFKESFENIKEKARDGLKKVGRSIAKYAKAGSFVALGASAMGVDSARGAAGRAKKSVTDRLEARKVRKSQEDAFASYEDNILYSEDHEEALRDNTIFDAQTEATKDNELFDAHTEAIHDNEVFDAHTEALKENERHDLEQAWNEARQDHMDGLHEEALDMNETFDYKEVRKNAELRARAARIAKIRRQQMYRETIQSVRDTSSETWQKAKSSTKKIGRSIAQFAKRAGSAVTAGARAARESYQASAE